MKMVIAYIRTECAAHVMRDLYNAGVGGITCYMVHGIRSEKPTFLYSTRPFEIHHLPASLKLEVICPDEQCDVDRQLDRAHGEHGKSRRRHSRRHRCRKDAKNSRGRAGGMSCRFQDSSATPQNDRHDTALSRRDEYYKYTPR